MTESRNCVQCGRVFTPRREHARFCSPRCRVAWNREHVSSPNPGEEALEWAMDAMLDTSRRLLQARGWDQPNGFAVVTEAVWWVTMVDATVVRYQPGDYNRTLSAQEPTWRQVIEDTLAGLRFVRNRMRSEAGHDDFIQAAPGPKTAAVHVAAWKWKPFAAPALSSLPARGQEWEMARYRAYQAQLAGHSVGDTFTDATDFLQLVCRGGLAQPARTPRPSAGSAR